MEVKALHMRRRPQRALRSAVVLALAPAAVLLLCCAGAKPADAKKGASRQRATCSDMQDAKDAKEAAEKLSAEGRRVEEKGCWERAAELDNTDPVPLIRLGNMAHFDGKLESARNTLEQARILAPSYSHVHSSIASVEYSAGGPQLQLAVQHYQLSIILPGGLTVHNLNNLGISYAGVKDWGAADRTYRLALRLWNDVSRDRSDAPAAALQHRQQVHTHGASVLLNMGNAYVEAERYKDAVSAYHRLLRVSPTYAVGHYSLGRAYDRAHDSVRALQSYRRCLALDPHLSNAYSNMGVIFLNEQRPQEAVGVLEVAERLRPSTNDLNNLGDALGDSGRYADAIAAYTRALDAAEAATGERFYPKALYSMLHYLIHTCSWSELRRVCLHLEATVERELAQGLETGMTPIEALVLLGTYTDHRLLMKVTHNFALRSLSRVKEAGHVRFRTYARYTTGKPVKVGYMSGGLRLHPDGKNLQGVFEHHDPDKVEVYCISLKRDGGSAVERKLQRTCRHFLDYTDLDNAGVASAINEIGVHVLLDINGYTGEGVRSQRSVILAYTPAPVQVNFLAWVASSGAPFMQYLISDTIASPPELQSDYSEKLMLFPFSYFPTDLRQSGGNIEQPASDMKRQQRLRSEKGLPPQGKLVSGFNQLWKIDEALFRAWLAVLNGTHEQDARLWLPLFPDVARPKLEAMAREVLGPSAPRRLVWTPLFGDEHLQVKALASLQLDTYVYCGHTSGADILWAGVPTLTLPGIKQSARVGASLLRGLGLEKLTVARNLGDYLDIARRALSQRPPSPSSAGSSGSGTWLEQVRGELASAKMKAPLFDTRQWTRASEAAVRMAWEVHLMGLLPHHVLVHPRPSARVTRGKHKHTRKRRRA